MLLFKINNILENLLLRIRFERILSTNFLTNYSYIVVYLALFCLELEGDALVAQAAVFFTGGFDTSSNTMSFALYELARNPETQTKLRNEILNAMETTEGKLTYDIVSTYFHYSYSFTFEFLILMR